MRAGAVLRRLCGAALLLAGVSAATFFSIRALVVPVRGSETGGRVYTAAWSSQGGEPGTSEQWQYTPEDLKLVETLGAEGWETRSVHDFAKALADWTDEDAFHTGEEAMERLSRTYEEDGTYDQFLRRTLSASLGEAGTRHYGGYCTRQRDSFYDTAVRERQADVFGDQYTVFQAAADYQVRYTIQDGDKLTVGERDRILRAYREELCNYLDSLTEKQLADEKAMKKKLETYLEGLDRRLSTDLMKLEGSSLVWYSAWGPESGD